jgi:hypothetical protein
MLLLSGCATDGSDTRAPCPPLVEYNATDQSRTATDIETLPEGAIMIQMMSNYAVLREQARACQ